MSELEGQQSEQDQGALTGEQLYAQRMDAQMAGYMRYLKDRLLAIDGFTATFDAFAATPDVVALSKSGYGLFSYTGDYFRWVNVAYPQVYAQYLMYTCQSGGVIYAVLQMWVETWIQEAIVRWRAGYLASQDQK